MLAWAAIDRRHFRHSTPIVSSLHPQRLCALFATMQNSSRFFSSASELFTPKHPGWGIPPIWARRGEERPVLANYAKLSAAMPSITTLDNLWTGRPHTIASALLESDGHRSIVDPGPGSTLETFQQNLQAHGIGVGDLNAILLTHIHLDHAGATGALVRENPRLAVHVHKNGAPHVIDPSKLLASAQRLWPNDLQQDRKSTRLNSSH